MFLVAVVLVLAASTSLQSVARVEAQAANDEYAVVEFVSDALSRISASGQRTVIYAFAEFSSPYDVAVDSDGNYMVTELDRKSVV